MKLSIGEFAKLRGVSTETLRHYDRIGLLKPVEIDRVTGYRYYSILQHEQLGTIKELKQLGMNLDEIKKFFDNRNLNQSINLLVEKREHLINTINEMKKLEESISDKITFLKNLETKPTLNKLTIKELDERLVICFEEPVADDIKLNYDCVKLESLLKEIAPILATNRFGAIVKNLRKKELIPFILIKENSSINDKYIKKIEKGLYGCMHYKGDFWDVYNYLELMSTELETNKYRIIGEFLLVIQIDITVTDRVDEILLEIQVPISHK